MDHASKTETNEGNLQGSGERILLVDDDPAILEALKTILGIYGYTVFCAFDAANALVLFEKEKRIFDLLFTDVTLPVTTGIELAEKILLLRPDMPVLLGSGYMNEESVSFITKGKRYPFMSKPYETEGLLRTIKKLLKSTCIRGVRDGKQQ